MEEAQFAERQVGSRSVYRGAILTLRVDEVELPSGRRSTREVVEHPGGVAIVAVDRDGSVILVRQYRYPIRSTLWEIPAGKLDPGESPSECAARELEEETGYRAKRLEEILPFYTSPGFCDEVLHLFFAKELVAGQDRPEEDELIETRRVRREEVEAMLARGEIRDGKTVLGLLAAMSKGLI
ncbi:MAG: NUDIX hydrolase [Firmicutes bacterium]|nr:NUDIX hydrolase [Bacillota bacterium]MDH7495526.1 NUDIX hydrolase [Bacillota bacterium]